MRAANLAPGGWIAKTDPEGKTWEIVSSGYRNSYDMDFNADGELFAYDADMEWDMGMPWYRPTRVVHAVSGSEFGWRSGTGKWPTYFADSVPPLVNIGPGSPVGVTFGYGTKFPAKYQKALYILDWTFGTIYAIHTEPDGASYTADQGRIPLPHAVALDRCHRREGWSVVLHRRRSRHAVGTLPRDLHRQGIRPSPWMARTRSSRNSANFGTNWKRCTIRAKSPKTRCN